ncbi:MAG: hypothetical protein NC131_07475 [Roseburia sp.]|nr:hypothetical protein [Roseburia sp.]
MKATKGLVKALIALAVSIVLCIGVCLAWFMENNRVDAKGINPGIRSTNITTFKVTAISLTDKKTETVEGVSVTSYTVGSPVDSTTPQMQPYGNIENKETALLLEFKYAFGGNLGKNYGIFAQLKKNLGTVTAMPESESTVYDFKCDLSAATGFYAATVNGTTVTRGGAITGGERIINLNGGVETDGVVNTELAFYCIIDYEETEIDQLYRIAGDMGGAIWSQMRFDNDIDFYMEEVNPS